MSNTQAAIEPVHKTVVVRCSPERAYEVFTREIGTWWPLGSHSIGGETITEGASSSATPTAAGASGDACSPGIPRPGSP